MITGNGSSNLVVENDVEDSWLGGKYLIPSVFDLLISDSTPLVVEIPKRFSTTRFKLPSLPVITEVGSRGDQQYIVEVLILQYIAISSEEMLQLLQYWFRGVNIVKSTVTGLHIAR